MAYDLYKILLTTKKITSQKGGKIGKLKEYVSERDLEAKLHETSIEVMTVEDAAEALDVETEDIIKSLVFFIDSKAHLVIGLGKDPIDEERLKDVLDAEEVRIASPEEVKEITGYSIGEVPPISIGLPKVIERRVIDKDIVYGGGGSIRHLLEIDPSELVDEEALIASIQ